MERIFRLKWPYLLTAGVSSAGLLILLVLAVREEGGGMNAVPAAGWIVLAALLILTGIPGKKKDLTPRSVVWPGWLVRTLNILTAVLSPVAAVWLVQNFTLYHLKPGTEPSLMWYLTNNIYPAMFAVNVLFYVLIFLILAFLTGSFRRGYLLADLIFMVIGIANYFVVQFRGSPIVPWDLMSLKTAAMVAGNYEYSITWRFFYTILGFVWLMALDAKNTWKIRRPVWRILPVVVLGGLLAAAGMQLQKTEVKDKLGMDQTLFTPVVRYRNNGFLAAFVGNLHLIQVEKPEGYSVKAVEMIRQELANGGEEQGAAAFDPSKTAAENNYPNVIVVVDEAFSDLSVLGEFNTNMDYMPNFRKAMEENDSGYAMVSIKGGNTANSEYEFLSGDTMAFMPAGSVVYQQFIRDNIPVLPSYLAGLGYSTIGIHPYLASGWNRDQVMPKFGFQQFLSQTDFIQPKLVRDYISDESAFGKIAELMENKGEDERMFIYEMTMQNHSGYSTEYPNLEEVIRLTDLSSVGVQSGAAQKYLSLIYETDRAFGMLMDYLNTLEEPTILIMFGDHQPTDYVTDVIRRLTGYDPEVSLEEAQKAYQVPYLVWNNFGMEMPEYKLTSLNYLAADVLKAAGLPTTLYQEFLLEMQRELPVVCSGAYVDAEGTYHTYDEKTEYDELLNRYQILQYNHLIDIDDRVSDLFARPADNK
ncbi:MAG: LTA synthase family protein [Lachnospiraceae bacterium]|nr:LTA synthase family protein [Lachnospiraceae bacterium]